MASRSAAVEDYTTACEVNECRWEHKREGTSKWEPFPAREHKVIETAHILKEDRARISWGNGYNSRVVVDLRNRSFSRGYGGTFAVRRIVLYTKAEILARKNRALVQEFVRNGRAKAFADKLFEKYMDEPDSDSDSEEEAEAQEQVISENLVEFCAALGISATSIEPAIVFWTMNVKTFMEVSREELYLFCHKGGIRDKVTLRAATAKLSALIASDADFGEFYRWNFAYYRSSQDTKKYIPMATAREVLQQILVPRYPEILKHLGTFMTQYKSVGISADTWKMVLDFSQNTRPDLSDMADFYPPFVDEYVDYLVANHGFKSPNAEESEEDDDFF